VDKQIYETLKTIKEYCASQGTTCKGCPLNTDPDCGCVFFNDTPEDWNIEYLKTD